VIGGKKPVMPLEGSLLKLLQEGNARSRAACTSSSPARHVSNMKWRLDPHVTTLFLSQKQVLGYIVSSHRIVF
jgi:hypothetical protein